MKVYFPIYRKLLHENDVPEDYYTLDQSGVYQPRRHWCYIAEIIRDDTFVRPTFLVKDKEGYECKVAFHFEGHEGPVHHVVTEQHKPPSTPSFNKVPCKVGNTICIMYAQRHGFMDFTQGIRVEDRDSVSVSPWSFYLWGSS